MFQNVARVLALNFLGCMWGYMGMHLMRKGLPILFLECSTLLAVALTILALAVGYAKARFVLQKTANRLQARVEHVKSLGSIFKILDLKFFVIIAAMIGLSLLMRVIPGFELGKSFIRTTVGLALLQSSFYFFKPAFIYGIRG